MTKVRKALISLGLAALLLGGVSAIVPQLLWSDHADYSHAASIKDSPGYQDPVLFQKAWALPVAGLYRKDIDFQKNSSFCGPTSVVNVSRSLGKFSDQDTILLGTGISPIMGFLPGGVTLDQLADLARRTLGRKVTVLRDLDLATFRDHLVRTNDLSLRYIVNFTRGPLFGHGGGHFSPIAGYLVDQDLVLVLDVNKKYGPWLVTSARLFEAMNTLDRTSGTKRGLLLIE